MPRRMFVSFLILVGLGAVGCGGDSGITPRAACEDSQSSMCERLYACYTPQELAAIGFPSNEAACVTTLQAKQGCSQQTVENSCTGNERYQPSEANTCIDQINGLACSQVRDPNLVLSTAATACAKVCVVD